MAMPPARAIQGYAYAPVLGWQAITSIKKIAANSLPAQHKPLLSLSRIQL